MTGVIVCANGDGAGKDVRGCHGSGADMTAVRIISNGGARRKR